MIPHFFHPAKTYCSITSKEKSFGVSSSIRFLISKRLVEDCTAVLLYQTAYNPSFRTYRKILRAMDLIAEILQHLLDHGLRLIRRYGVYSFLSCGTQPSLPIIEEWLIELPLPKEAPAIATTRSRAIDRSTSESIPLPRFRANRGQERLPSGLSGLQDQLDLHGDVERQAAGA